MYNNTNNWKDVILSVNITNKVLNKNNINITRIIILL